MISSIKKNIFINSIIIFISRLLSIAANFVVVPFIIYKLGNSGFGTWESIIALSSVATIILLSLSQTLIWKFSILLAQNKIKEVYDWLNFSILLIIIQLLVLVPLFYIFSDFIIITLNIPSEFSMKVKELIPFVIGIVLIGGLNEILGAILSGLQKTGIVNLYKSIGIIVGQFFSIFFLQLNFGIYSVFLGLVINIIFVNIIITLKCKNQINLKNRFCIPKLDKEILLYFFFTLIGFITLTFRTHISKFVIAYISTIDAVANYGIASRISSLIFFAVTFIMPPTLAAVSKLFGKNEIDTINSLFNDLLSFFSIINCIVTAFLSINIEIIVYLWIGDLNSDIITYSLILIIGQSIAVQMTTIGVSFTNGLGKREIETKYIIINLIINFISLPILVKYLSSIGALLSTSFSWAISGIIFSVMMHKNLDLPIKSTIKSFSSLIITFIFIYLLRLIDFSVYSFSKGELFIIIFLSTIIIVISIVLLFYFIKFLPEKINNILNKKKLNI